MPYCGSKTSTPNPSRVRQGLGSGTPRLPAALRMVPWMAVTLSAPSPGRGGMAQGLPGLGQGPCEFGAAVGALGLWSAGGSPRAAVHGGCPSSLCGDRSSASTCVPGTASTGPAAEVPPASPQQQARRRGRHGAVQPGGLPAEQRPWRGPSGGRGAGERQRLFPGPGRRGGSGWVGRKADPPPGPPRGRGRAPGQPGRGRAVGWVPASPSPVPPRPGSDV